MGDRGLGFVVWMVRSGWYQLLYAFLPELFWHLRTNQPAKIDHRDGCGLGDWNRAVCVVQRYCLEQLGGRVCVSKMVCISAAACSVSAVGCVDSDESSACALSSDGNLRAGGFPGVEQCLYRGGINDPQAGKCPTALAGAAAANSDRHDRCFAASIADIMAAVGVNRYMGADKPLIFYCA